jgi:hypothetical protein
VVEHWGEENLLQILQIFRRKGEKNQKKKRG